MGIFGQSRQNGMPTETGAVASLQVTESVLGSSLTICVGTQRLHPKLLWYGAFNAQQQSEPGGSGIFGGKNNLYEYYASVVMALCQGPCTTLRNVWSQSGILENLTSYYDYTVPSGGGSYQPVTGNAAPIVTNVAVTKSVAYSVDTNDYGGSPKTLTGTQQVAMVEVESSPGAGQYSYDPATGTYTFGAAEEGSNVSIVISSMFSLYYYEQQQAAIIPSSSPWAVTTDNQSYFYADDGVIFVDNNSAGIPVGGTPSATNEYHESGGNYTFYSGDAGRMVYINYTYVSDSSTITTSSVLNLTFFNGAQSQAPWSYLESQFPSAAFGYTCICYVGSDEMDLGESPTLPQYNFEVTGPCIAPASGYDAALDQVITFLLTDDLVGIDIPASALDTAGTWVTAIAHWYANGYFISDNIDAQSGYADTLKQYCDAGNTAAFFSGGLLKLVPYSEVSAVGNGYTYTPPTNPVGTLQWSDIVPPSKDKPGKTLSDDFITIDEKAAQDRYNYTQCNWTDRENSYNNDLLSLQNDAAIYTNGIRIEDALDYTFIALRTAANWALGCHLGRSVYIYKTYKFSLTYCWDFLEPMDVLVLPTGIPVRITKIDEDTDQILDIEAENFLYGASSATIYPSTPPTRYQPNQQSAAPGSTYPAFIQNTTAQTGGALYRLTVAAAGDNPNWAGCQVWISIDGENYSKIGAINEPCCIGVLTAPLNAVADPDTTVVSLTDGGTSGYTTAAGLPTTTSGSGTGLEMNIVASGGVVTGGAITAIGWGYAVGDQIYPTQAGSSGDAYFTVTQAGETLSVDMSLSGFELAGTTQAVADSFGSLCALISPDGSTSEFISYENVELTATNRYNLNYLRRGAYGTMPAAFPQGSTFVYVGSQDLFQYQYAAQFIGQPLFVKLASFNTAGQAVQPLSQCRAYELFITTQGASPIGTTYLPSAYTESGNVAVTNPAGPYAGGGAASGGVSSENGSAAQTCDCTWNGFPSFVTDGSQKLYVSYSISGSSEESGYGVCGLSTSEGGGAVVGTGNLNDSLSGTLIISIPSGTNIDTISVSVAATASAPTGIINRANAGFRISNIFIQ